VDSTSALTRHGPEVAAARRRRVRYGVILGLAGHIVAVAAGFIVANIPHWDGLEGLGAGAGMFIVIEAVVVFNGLIALSRRATRALGVGFFYGWLGALLLLLAGITANSLRYR
jgi:hypothetical protein